MNRTAEKLGMWVLTVAVFVMPFLALGALITVCILIPPLGVGIGFILLLHVPIVCGMIWGSEETKQAIADYHPPGHD